MSGQRHPLYPSGDLFLPAKVRKFLETELVGRQRDTFYITYWSLIHAVSGFAFGFVMFKFFAVVANYYTIALIVHSFWEMWQVYIGMAHPLALKGKGNIVDILMDTAMFMAGVAMYKELIRG
jgi:hypothetical protein